MIEIDRDGALVSAYFSVHMYCHLIATRRCSEPTCPFSSRLELLLVLSAGSLMILSGFTAHYFESRDVGLRNSDSIVPPVNPVLGTCLKL